MSERSSRVTSKGGLGHAHLRAAHFFWYLFAPFHATAEGTLQDEVDNNAALGCSITNQDSKRLHLLAGMAVAAESLAPLR